MGNRPRPKPKDGIINPVPFGYQKPVELDYEELLDLWFEDIMQVVAKIESKAETEHEQKGWTYKKGCLDGFADGLIMATSMLNNRERKMRRKCNK